MKTADDPTTQYIDAAIERMEAGLDRRIRARRTRSIAVVSAAAAAALLVSGGGVLALRASTVTSPPQALGTTQLSAADIASWTSHPRLGVEAPGVVAQCKQHLAREPFAFGQPVVVGSDMRGNVQSVLISQGRYLAECIGARNADSAFVLIASPESAQPVPPANTIALGITGGNTLANGWAFAQGTLGKGVTSITLHENGLPIEATIAGDNWMAWWPTHNFQGAMGGTITFTGVNGATATVTPAQIQTN